MAQNFLATSGNDAESMFQEMFRKAFGKKRQRRNGKGLSGTEPLETRVLLSGTPVVDEGTDRWDMPGRFPSGRLGIISADRPAVTFSGGLQTKYRVFSSNDVDIDTVLFELAEDAGPLSRVVIKVSPSGANGQPLIPTRKAGADSSTTVDLNRLISAEVATTGHKRGLQVVNDDTLYVSLNGLPKGIYGLTLKITDSIGSVWTPSFTKGGLSYSYHATVENPTPQYPIQARDFFEPHVDETNNSTASIGTIGLNKPTTVVNGYLNSHAIPTPAIDHDTYEFRLPSRGMTGSQIRISYLPADGGAGRIRDLIQATLTTHSGQITIRPDLPKDAKDDREIVFNLKGFDAQTPFQLELKSPTNVAGVAYSAEFTHLLPQVSLGEVVSLSEGFGYLSTIEGLGKAFDASGQLFHSQLAQPVNLGATNRATVESWFYPKSAAGSATIWEFKNKQNQITYQLRQVNGRGLHVYVRRTHGGTDNYFDAGKSGVLNTDAWNHLAMTFDGRQLRLFVNGVSVLTLPEASGNSGIPSVLGDIRNVTLGGGIVDELRIWNVARTQAEVQQGLLSAFSGSEPGLQGFWSFDKLNGVDIQDLSPNKNVLHLSATRLVENAVPQIGYVEVLLDQKVSDPKGLFVTYELSGTAKAAVDFIPSRFRTVTADPGSEREGIIIPFGEKSGRIYFMAKPDAFAEAAETINVALKTFSFEGLSGGQDYRIGAHSSKSLEIADSGAYKVGIAMTDASGRTVSANNPLHVDPITKRGTFFFRLTSQPTAAVERIDIQMDPHSTLNSSTTPGGRFAVDVKAEDWNKPIEFTVRSFLTSGSEGSIEFRSETRDGHGNLRTDRYLTTPLRFSTTLNLPPREARPTEGSVSDAVSTTPTVNLKHLKDVREDASKPGLFSVELSAPAPAGGLVVHYTVSTTSHATAGSDYRRLPGFVFVPAGLRQAEIPVYAIDDFVFEGASEDLVISLQSNSHYHIGTAGNSKVAIVEDDHSGIAVVNTSIIDVAVPKSPSRPVNLSEGTLSERYTTNFNVLPSVGKSGTYEVPTWSYTGGLASKVTSSDGDTIPFEMVSAGDSTAKLTLTLTPTASLGSKTLPTVRTGGDLEHNINLDRLLRSGLRLSGSGNSTAAHVVGDNQIEWSLAGLAAGRYLVDLSLPVISQILPANTDPAQVLTYEYRLDFSSSPVAPFEISTTRTETGLSSSYSNLITNEPLTSQSAQLEPNNNTISSAPDLGVVTQIAEVLKQTISSTVDLDHFRFTLDSTLGRPDTMIARFTHTSQSDLRLQLLSTSGTVIRTSDEQSNNEYMDLRDLHDGKYVALVTASPRGASRFVEEPYALKLTRLQSAAEPGPNDDLYTAPHLGAVHNGDRFSDFSLSTVTDQDYFRFTLDTTNGRPDSVSLLSIAADGMLGMSLHSLADDREVSRLSGNQTSLPLIGLADGIYGVRIFRFAPGTMNKYDLGFGTITPLAGERNLSQVAVRLDSRPTANVSLTFHSDDLTEGSVTGVPFVFTPDNWDQPQYVTITPLADHDSGSNRNITYTVTGNATSTDPNYHHRTIRFAVTNVDNGELVSPTVPSQLEHGAPVENNLPTLSIQKLRRNALPEGHTDDAFMVKLDRSLTSDLLVGVDFRRGTANYGEDFVAVTGSSLTNSTSTPGIVNVLFRAGEISKIIQLSLIDDKVAETSNGTDEIVRAAIVDAKEFRVDSHADPGFTDIITISDINKAGVTVLKHGSPAGNSLSTVTEDVAGSPTEYTLKLDTKPTANVIVSIGSSDVSEGMIARSVDGARADVVHLVFTPTNWNVSQSIFLKGVEDHSDDGDVPFTLVVSVQGEDDVYRKVSKQTFSNFNVDNDTLGINVSNPLTTVDGRQNIFNVTLRSQPISDVRVTMNVPDEQLEIEGARAGDPYTLTFTPSNWDLPQLVRVTAVDDDIVENFHRSQVVFQVEVGRAFSGPGIADNFTAERALDLGEINGGVRWTNMMLRESETRIQQDEWFRIKLTSGGSSLNKLRLAGLGGITSKLPSLTIYSADGKQVLRHIASADASTREISLLGIAAREFLIKIGQRDSSHPFNFYIDDADRAYESVDLPPLPVSIKDNDLPTAEIIAGPTASEVFGKPSYFAVRLNAPTAAEESDSGIKVNFRITGGRATVGTSSSTLHDYTVLADHFTIDPHNPAIGTGWIRVAPGDLQANIGIVPVDDKAVEDQALAIHRITPIVGGYDMIVSTIQNASAPAPILQAHTQIDIQLPDGSSIPAEVLHRKSLSPSNPLPGQNHEYRDHLEVSISPSDYARAAAFQGVKFKAKVESEDVRISLLPGDGYLLPKAPDRQGTTGNNLANLDPSRVTSVMTIYDDDTPGIQVVEMGQHTTLAEGEENTFQVALTAEPQHDVTVTLTPGGGLNVVDPASVKTKTINTTVYTLGTAGVPDTVDLVLNSVHETDQGLTAVFDARLSRINMSFQETESTLMIGGTNGRSSSSAVYTIPGSNPSLVDAAGNPLDGNWHTIQRLIISRLEKKSNGTIELKLKLTGHAETTITLTPTTVAQVVSTSSLVFTPSNWFQLQTVKIAAPHNSKAEPGEWHQDSISYGVASTDLNWDGLAVPVQEVHVEDTLLDAGDTLDGIRSGLGMLQDSLLGLEVPVLGSIGQLPGIGDVFADFEEPLEKSLANTEDLTVNKFKLLAESALQPLVDRGLLDSVEVTPEANSKEVRVVFDLAKTIHVGQFDLSADLGLDALGITFNTQGKASADLEFRLTLGFGWSHQFGFFLDAGNTAIHMGAKLKLEGNGATADNPENLFTGQGSIGFLQVNFKDDVDNRTELGITFDVTLNDLDNLSTVNFFDINGDGILDENSYAHGVGKDTNHDGRIDTNSSGDQQFESRIVAEPWVGIDSQGESDDFPVVNSQSSDALLKLAANANWNTRGTKVDSFDEAELIRKEGVYRKKTLGNRTIVYLDANRDGKLNISRRNADPFALSWTSLSDREKNGSEIWFSPTNVNQPGELKILTTGAARTQKFFVDLNFNQRVDSTEEISTRLRKKLDKNKSGGLEGDVIQDGEGQYGQGTSVAFYDQNLNGRLDHTEKYISYSFEDFQLSTEVFSEDSAGKMFLDLNHDGIRESDELVLGAGTGETVFLDINRNSAMDAIESKLSAAAADGSISIASETANTSSDGRLINLGGIQTQPGHFSGGITRGILTIDGVRFIDLDGNGELTLDAEDRPMEPAAEQASTLNFEDVGRLVYKIHQVNNSLFPGIPDTLMNQIATQAKRSTVGITDQQTVTTAFNKLVSEHKIVLQANDGDRLTLAELAAFVKADRSEHVTKGAQVKAAAAELFTYQFQGIANLGLETHTTINGSSMLPSMQFDLAVNLPLFNYGNAEASNDNGMNISFNNVALDLGSFINKFVTPIVTTANDLIDPIKPLIKALNADTVLPGMLGMRGMFESDGKPGISLLEIARKLSPGNASKIDKAIKFADHVTKLVNLVDTLHKSLSSEESLLEFGDFSLSDLRAASDDPANTASRPRSSTTRSDGTAPTRANLPTTTASGVDQQAGKSGKFRNKYNALKSLDGFKINLFEPSTVLSLITGESNVTLVTYDIPDFEFDFTMKRKFSIWGPIAGLLEGGFNVKTDLSIGFDTRGIEEWSKDSFAANKSYLVFDGLYLDDWNAAGGDKDEMTVKAFIGAGVGLDVGIANGFVKGGVEGIIGLDFVDVGEQSGTSDGKIRGSDIVQKLSTNPADLFDLHGVINAFLAAEINVDFFFYSATVYEKRLATVQLAKFKLNSNGSSGSSTAGNVQTGPISGATVWFDANNNLIHDPGEPTTHTDVTGHYELIIPDRFGRTNGVIRTEGGLDASTGLKETDNLALPAGVYGNITAFTALEEALILEPISTSVFDFNHDGAVSRSDRSAYLALRTSRPGHSSLDVNHDGAINDLDLKLLNQVLVNANQGAHLPVSYAHSVVKAAFKIDPTINLASFAHFDQAMTGNRLASPVLIAENTLNSIVTEIESLLAGLAGQSSDDLHYSGIFSEAAFIAIGRQLLRSKPNKFDLGSRAQLRVIILEAAMIAEELIGSHSFTISINHRRLNAILDAVVVVMSATVAEERALARRVTNPVDLARLITEWKVYANGTVSHDLHEAANGHMSGQRLLDADGHADRKTLDKILHIPLPPLFAEVPDQIVNQNDFLTRVPVKLTRQNVGPGTILLVTSNDNKRLLPDGSISITELGNGRFHLGFYPAENQVGVAHITLRGIDTAGGSADQVVTITVMPTVDATSQGVTLTDDGLLTILGSSEKDTVFVERSGSQLIISSRNRQQSISKTLSLGDVRHVVLRLGSGNDTAQVAASVGLPVLVFGGDGHDNIVAGAGTSVVFGGDGNDVLRGGRANDVLVGGVGNDRLVGNDGNDRLLGSEGNDWLSGGGGQDQLLGGTGNDWLWGEAGDDRIQGESGNDSLDGGTGNDQLDGGAGDDNLKGKAGKDLLIGGAGKDVLRGFSGNDILIGGRLSIADDTAAMQAIFSEWTAARGHASRVANLRKGVGLQKQFRLGGETILDDNSARDRVIGGSDIDWFFSSARDVVVDFKSRVGESRDNI